MKIKLFFNPQALKNIKPTLQLIYKLLQTSSQLPNVYFVYIIKTKNVRFLIDSRESPIIISLGSQMLNIQSSCSVKEDKQLVSILFEDTKMFFENLINVLEKQDQFGLFFDIKKQVLEGKQCKFLKLTFKNNDRFISRISVETPRYDVSEVKFHPWICGCQENHREVEITVYLDELLNMMRYMLKMKLPVDTKLQINFNLSTRTYTSRSSDPHCLPHTQGQLKIVSSSTLQTQFNFEINISDLKTVYQMIRKSKQLKVIISNANHFVFVFMKEDLFVCHVDMSLWIHPFRQGGVQAGNGMKIQEVEHDEEGSDEDARERWN